ncbi:MAG: hypothetical protein OEO84_02690 [Betaproteobacteria bacterium]|nr:hypothetical protein [Betaproteobacteria bacterium]
MRNSLWIIIVIMSAIMGYMLGYATSPMIETGLIGGKPAPHAATGAGKKELEQYYQDLFKEK